jgi:hypothetical protein
MGACAVCTSTSAPASQPVVRQRSVGQAVSRSVSRSVSQPVSWTVSQVGCAPFPAATLDGAILLALHGLVVLLACAHINLPPVQTTPSAKVTASLGPHKAHAPCSCAMGTRCRSCPQPPRCRPAPASRTCAARMPRSQPRMRGAATRSTGVHIPRGLQHGSKCYQCTRGCR